MPNRDPLAGIIPRGAHPANDDETNVTQYVERMEGEVELDA
jgi:hypothetical protein